ncbi:MAG: hypothetical protein Q4D26_10610 [Clostridia bacterium]|nr:hypothetical protein [Clostridia bacterium]
MKKNIIIGVITVLIVIFAYIGYTSYLEYSKNKSIEEHFGNVELSEDEIEQMAKDAVLGDKADVYDSYESESDKTLSMAKNIVETEKSLYKYIDETSGKLSSKEIESYRKKFTDYIDEAKSFLEQDELSTMQGNALLFSGSENSVRDTLSKHYIEQKETLDKYSAQLSSTIDTFLTDKTISSDEQNNIKQQISLISDTIGAQDKIDIYSGNYNNLD